MSPSNTITETSDTKKIVIPQYIFPKFVIISILTILSIGPQYFLNISFILNQIIIENEFGASADDQLLLSILSNVAFTICVPIGPAIAKKYGLKKSFLSFVFIFFCGSLINAFSPHETFLIIGRILQGLSSGSIFLTILPVSLVSFPNKVRNWFLFLAIGGLFGSSAVGAIFGSLSLAMDAWRWLYVASSITSLLCLIVGFFILPESPPQQYSIDKWGLLSLFVFMGTLVYPLFHLHDKGFLSGYVWPPLLLAFLIFAVFLLIDFGAKNPLIPYGALFSARPIFGTIMGAASHIVLILLLAGSSGLLRTIRDTPVIYVVQFYCYFLVGVLVSAVLCTWLYDKWGAGILGCIGSLAVILVGYQWRIHGDMATLSTLDWQVACLGGGISMTLVSGALSTALSGDIHKASMRSVSLHFTRNLAGVIISPFIGWFLYWQNDVHYNVIRETMTLDNPMATQYMIELTQQFINNGHSAAEAVGLANYTMFVTAQKASILGAYQNLFTILICFAVIMLIASIGKAATGKGRSLVQKEVLKSDSAPVTSQPLHQNPHGTNI